MDNPDYLRARAEEALRILEGPVFADAMAATKEAFIREWTEADTVAAREAAHAKVCGLVEVQRQLRRIVSRGTVAGAR